VGKGEIDSLRFTLDDNHNRLAVECHQCNARAHNICCQTPVGVKWKHREASGPLQAAMLVLEGRGVIGLRRANYSPGSMDV